METSGVKTEIVLPDWELVSILEARKGIAPPFFAVEVEELPRGSGIEWHAHLGVVGVVVNVSSGVNMFGRFLLITLSLIYAVSKAVGWSLNAHLETRCRS